MLFKRQDAAPAENRTGGHTRSQNIVFFSLLLAAVLFVICWWGRALTSAYYGAFAAYTDENAASMLENNSRLSVSDEDEALLGGLQDAYDSWRTRHLADRCDTVSSDGTALHGLYYDCGFDRTVIVFPGYAVTSEGDFLYAPWYEQQGYNVLLTDTRRSGGSGGDFLGYGIFEQYDAAAWADYAVETLGSRSVLLHGTGMGASAILTAAGDGLLRAEVKGLVAESAFCSLRELADYEMGNWFRMPSFPLLNLMNAKLEREAGYSLEDADLSAVLPNAEIPALFLAGGDDRYIPAAFSQSACDAYGGEKTWLLIPGAAHGMLYYTAQDQVESAIAALVS